MLKDKKILAMTILMPIVLTTILSFALKTSFNDLSTRNKIEIGIVKEYDLNKEVEEFKDMILSFGESTEIDEDDLSFEEFNMEKIFFDDFLDNEELSKIIDYSLVTKEEGMNKIKDGTLPTIIILPEGFIKDNMVNLFTPFRNQVEIKVIGNPDYNISTMIVEEMVEGFSNIMAYNTLGKNVFMETYLKAGGDNNYIEHLEPIMLKINDVINIKNDEIEVEKLRGRPPMTSLAYYSFSMSAMFMLFAAGFGSKLLLEEKDNQTYGRMLVSGVRKSTIVIGKTFTIFLYTMLQLSIMFVYSNIALKVEWGNFYYVFLVFILSAFAVAGIGIMLASITLKSGNYNVGDVFTTAIVNVMSAIGGSFFPIEMMSPFLRYLSKFTFNGVVIKAFTKIYYGYTLKDLAGQLLVLFITGIVSIGVAIYFLKLEEREGAYYEKHNSIKVTENT